MIRRPPRSTLSSSSAASDVYKRQPQKAAQESENKETSPHRLALRRCNHYHLRDDPSAAPDHHEKSHSQNTVLVVVSFACFITQVSSFMKSGFPFQLRPFFICLCHFSVCCHMIILSFSVVKFL